MHARDKDSRQRGGMMKGFFYNLGKRAAPAALKARWVYRSLTGTESEKIQAEYSMGCHLTSLHLQEAKLDRDPKILAWLNALSSRLALALVNRERTFQVRCLAGSEANAFALPGGFLFVSRALLELCEFDEDEIAFVVAHEIAHVLRSHAVNRLLTSEIVQLLSRGTPVRGVLQPVLSRLIRQLVTQGYSRRQEFEADKAAVQIARVAGYDPRASIRLFRRLQAEGAEPRTVAGYFSSHPSLTSRMERIGKALAESDR